MAAPEGFIQGYRAVINLYPSGTASAQLHTNLTSFTLRHDRANQDVTTFGDTTMQRLAGIRDYTVDFAGILSGSSASQSAESVANIEMAGSGITYFEIAPASESGCVVYAGCSLLSNVTVTGQPNSPIAISFSLQSAAGSLTRKHI